MYNETQMFPSAYPTTLAYEMSKETLPSATNYLKYVWKSAMYRMLFDGEIRAIEIHV